MANNAITPAVLRVTEAAQYLACSERTIWNLIKSEKIRQYGLGKFCGLRGPISMILLQQLRGQNEQA
jgi:excisionase family DNA binding protein